MPASNVATTSSCPKCDAPDSDDNMISCNLCDKWYHHECEALSKKEFELFANKLTLPYTCLDCQPLLGSTAVAKFARTIGNRVETLEETSKQYGTRLTTLESNITFKDSKEFEDAVSEIIVDRAIGIKADMHEIYIRRKRVIISGAKDESDDRQLVTDLLTEMGEPGLKVRSHFRLKKPSNSTLPPLLNVEFETELDKHKSISKECREKLENLQNAHKFYGIKVFPDRSFREREEYKYLKDIAAQKNLVAQAGEKWIIRSMRITKIKINQSEG